GSRMRESRTYGSVRGARGNSRPYRVDVLCSACVGYWHQAAHGKATGMSAAGESGRYICRSIGRNLPGRALQGCIAGCLWILQSEPAGARHERPFARGGYLPRLRGFAYSTTSTFTFATPAPTIPSDSAAECETSTIRPRTNGPRSLTRT